MQNIGRMRELLKLTAREAKANRAVGLSLVDQVLYSLLVQERQARSRREYTRALDCMLTYRVLKAGGSISKAWASLQEQSVLGDETGRNTPASNTGVTESPAAVPMEYFTGGK